MKITFLSPEPNLSGGVRVIATYADLLKSRGHDVTIIAPKIRQPTAKQKLKAALNGKFLSRRPVVSHYNDSSADIRTIVHDGPFTDADVPDADVVIATWWETAFMAASMSQQKGRKFYLVQHHEIHRPQKRHLIAGSYHLPMQKIVVSEWLRDVMKTTYGDDNVIVVPNSVDTTLFHAPSRDKQASPAICMMYAPTHFKGTDLAIEALANVQKSIPDLRVVAFGKSAPNADYPMPKNWEYHLRPSQENIRKIYASSDGFMFPSRAEGFGLPVLEAMACGTPVVGTRAGCGPDFILPGKTGYLTDIASASLLEEATLKLLQLDNTEWRTMAKNAQDLVKQYSWTEATLRLEEALGAASR